MRYFGIMCVICVLLGFKATADDDMEYHYKPVVIMVSVPGCINCKRAMEAYNKIKDKLPFVIVETKDEAIVSAVPANAGFPRFQWYSAEGKHIGTSNITMADLTSRWEYSMRSVKAD